MDQDLVTEDSKIGDFKRQLVGRLRQLATSPDHHRIMKEALSLKFGGLEELGGKDVYYR